MASRHVSLAAAVNADFSTISRPEKVQQFGTAAKLTPRVLVTTSAQDQIISLLHV